MFYLHKNKKQKKANFRSYGLVSVSLTALFACYLYALGIFLLEQLAFLKHESRNHVLGPSMSF